MRVTYEEQKMDDCITIYDSQEKLKTDFGTEIVISPAEDAKILVNEINKKEEVIKMLTKELESYEDPEDIKYWIDDIEEEFE